MTERSGWLRPLGPTSRLTGQPVLRRAAEPLAPVSDPGASDAARATVPWAAPMARVATRAAGTTWPSHFWRVVIPAIAITAIVTAGSVLGSGAVTAVGAGLALLAAVVAPEIGLGVLVALAPLLPPPGIPAPGLNFLLVGALLLGCLYRLPVDRPVLRLSRSGWFLLGFFVYITAQQLPDMLAGYRGDEGHAVGYLFFQVVTGFGTVVVAGYVLRGRSPLAILTMALVGATIATIVTVATFDSVVSGPPFGGLVATPTDIGVRAAGPFVNPNYMGTFAAAALVAIAGVGSAFRSGAGRGLLIGLAILCAAALVESQSRGAILAGFAAIAALAWLRNRPLAIGIVAVGLVGAVLIYPAFVQWRLANEHGDVTDASYVAIAESDEARLNASIAGPAMFAAEPIFGVGFGRFTEKSVEISHLATGINAHNWYISILGEQGTTGVVLWIGAMIATVAELRSRSGVARLVGVGMFIVIAVGAVFLEIPMSFQLAALPSVFLVAALVATWPDHERAGRTTGSTVPKMGEPG